MPRLEPFVVPSWWATSWAIQAWIIQLIIKCVTGSIHAKYNTTSMVELIYFWSNLTTTLLSFEKLHFWSFYLFSVFWKKSISSLRPSPNKILFTYNNSTHFLLMLCDFLALFQSFVGLLVAVPLSRFYSQPPPSPYLLPTHQI